MRAAVTLGSIVLAAAAQESRPVAIEARDPPAWSPAAFERILYLNGRELRTAQDLATLKRLGFTSVMTGDVRQATLAHGAGLGVVQDQIVGKGVLELRDAQWGPLPRAYSESRNIKDLVRPALLDQPATRAALRAEATRRLTEFWPLRPWAVSLGDEVSVTRHRNPLDLCFAEPTLAKLRQQLGGRYSTIEALNAAWGTTFPSFSHARPFTADEIRARELGHGLPRNLAPWAEHRAQMDRALAATVADLAVHVRAHDPSLRLGLFGMQPPAAYGGHDLAQLLPFQTACEVYDEGGSRLLARSLAAPGTMHFATLGPDPKSQAQELVLAKVSELVARGLAGVIVWSSEQVLAQDGQASEFGSALGSAFARLAPAFKFGNARMPDPEVVIVESQPSVRAWWMLDSERDGPTWVRRLSSYESTHSTSMATREGWVQVLADLGYQPAFVAEADLDRVLAGRARPRVVILAGLLAVADSTVKALLDAAKSGTVVLADFGTAIYDESLVLRATGALDQYFGIARPGPELARLPREGVPQEHLRLESGAAAAEPGLEPRGAVVQRMLGTVVHAERAEGAGRFCYLNLALCEYPRLRLDPARVAAARELRRHVQRELEAARAHPVALVSGAGLPTCVERSWLTSSDGTKALVVRIDALARPEVLAEIAQRGPLNVVVTFREAASVIDLLHGGKARHGQVQECRLDPWAGLYLAIVPEPAK